MPDVKFAQNSVIVEHATATPVTPVPPPPACTVPFTVIPESNSTLKDIDLAATPVRVNDGGAPSLQMTVSFMRQTTLTGFALRGTPGTGKYALVVLTDDARDYNYAEYIDDLSNYSNVKCVQVFDAAVLDPNQDTLIPFDEPQVMDSIHHEFILFDAHHLGLHGTPLAGSTIQVHAGPVREGFGAYSYNSFSAPLDDPEPFPVAVVTYTSYFYYPGAAFINQGSHTHNWIFGPDTYDVYPLPHYLWRGYLCVDTHDQSPLYEVTYTDSSLGSNSTILVFDPEDNSHLMEWQGLFVGSVLKGMTFYLKNDTAAPVMRGEFILEEITQNPYSNLQEYTPLTRVYLQGVSSNEVHAADLNNFPLKGFRTINSASGRKRLGFRLSTFYGSPEAAGTWGSQVGIASGTGSTVTYGAGVVPDGVWTAHPLILGGSGGGYYQHEARLELETDIVPDGVTLPSVTGTPTDFFTPQFLEGGELRLLRFDLDAYDFARIKHMDVRTRQTGGGLGALRLCTPFSSHETNPNLYEAAVVDIPATQVVHNGYTRFDFSAVRENGYGGTYDFQKGKTMRFFLTDACWNWGVHFPAVPAYDLYPVERDPVSGTVSVPVYAAPTGHQDLTPDFAVFDVCANLRGQIEVYSPGTNSEIDALNASTSANMPYGAYIQRSVTPCGLDVRFTLNPHTTGDSSIYKMGRVNTLGAQPFPLYGGSTPPGNSTYPNGSFKWGFTLNNQPELTLFDFEMPTQNNHSTLSLELKIKVFVVPGIHDPNTFDVADLTHLKTEITQVVPAGQTLTRLHTENQAFNFGAGLTGVPIPEGTHTVIFEFSRQDTPSGYNIWAIETPDVPAMFRIAYGSNLPNVTPYPVIGYPNGLALPVLRLTFDGKPRT